MVYATVLEYLLQTQVGRSRRWPVRTEEEGSQILTEEAGGNREPHEFPFYSPIGHSFRHGRSMSGIN